MTKLSSQRTAFVAAGADADLVAAAKAYARAYAAFAMLPRPRARDASRELVTRQRALLQLARDLPEAADG